MDNRYIVQRKNSELQLSLNGPLKQDDIDALRTEIEHNLDTCISTMVINLSSLSTIDSITLGFFAWIHRIFDVRGMRVRFTHVNSHIMKIFETVGFLTHSKAFLFDQSCSALSPKQSATLKGSDLPRGEDALLKVEHRMFYPSSYELSQMRTFLDDFLGASTLTRTQKDDIRIFSGEAFANAITHGARDTDSPCVRVDLRLYQHEFVIDVYDNGREFDGNFVPPSDMFRTHGRGILLMRELADSVEFILNSDDPLRRGTTVRLVKRLD